MGNESVTAVSCTGHHTGQRGAGPQNASRRLAARSGEYWSPGLLRSGGGPFEPCPSIPTCLPHTPCEPFMLKPSSSDGRFAPAIARFGADRHSALEQLPRNQTTATQTCSVRRACASVVSAQGWTLTLHHDRDSGPHSLKSDTLARRSDDTAPCNCGSERRLITAEETTTARGRTTDLVGPAILGLDLVGPDVAGGTAGRPIRDWMCWSKQSDCQMSSASQLGTPIGRYALVGQAGQNPGRAEFERSHDCLRSNGCLETNAG